MGPQSVKGNSETPYCNVFVTKIRTETVRKAGEALRTKVKRTRKILLLDLRD